MKKIFLLIGLAVASHAHAQTLPPNTAAIAGDYVGVMLPARICSTERMIVLLTVNADASLTGSVVTWDNDPVFDFESAWPFLRRGVFKSTITPGLVSGARGSFSVTTGSIAGTVDMRPDGGCLYTFKAYRRYRLN